MKLVLLTLFLLFILYLQQTSTRPRMYVDRKRPNISYLEQSGHLKTLFADCVQHGLMDVCWPAYGTLIGFERENDLICYDYDVDVQAFSKDFEKVLKIVKRMCISPDYTYSAYNNVFGKCIVIYKLDPFLRCDITFFKQASSKKYKRDVFFSHFYFLKHDNIFYKHDLYPTKKETKYGFVLYPSNADAVLTQIYGDYMTPSRRVDSTNCEALPRNVQVKTRQV